MVGGQGGALFVAVALWNESLNQPLLKGLRRE
jgi:hypothetical protein